MLSSYRDSREVAAYFPRQLHLAASQDGGVIEYVRCVCCSRRLEIEADQQLSAAILVFCLRLLPVPLKWSVKIGAKFKLAMS